MALKLKLPARLALLFLAAGLVPLAVTLLVLLPRGQNALRTSAQLLHEAKVDALRARVDSALDDLLADVRLSALPSGSEEERRALLRFLLEKHQELTIVTLYDGQTRLPGGQAFDRRQVSDADLAEHEARARKLLGGHGLRASDFYPSLTRKQMLVTFVVPFSPAGKNGQLAAEISLQRVQELVAHTHVGRRGYAFLVDGAGRLVAHPDLARALAREDLSSLSVVRELRANIARAADTGRPLTVVTDFTDGGVAQVGAFAPLARLRWGVVVEEPRDDAYGLARAAWAHAAGFTLLALSLTLLVAVFFARRITRPVYELVAGTERLARGELGGTVPVSGPPEVAELGRAFNDASQRLARYDKENRELLGAVERGYLETLRALVNAIEAKDPYTAGHSQRTAEFSVAIARALGLSEGELNDIEYGGLLHDIGKMGIPEQILRKPAGLEPEEMTIMRAHPVIGSEMTRGVELLARIRPMIRNHHERFDGSGYPDGLRGDAIPLSARIVAVADTFDAIVSDRPYSKGRSPAEAMTILLRLSGTTLDREVVEALGRGLTELGLLDANTALPPPDPSAPTLTPTDERTGRVDLDALDESKEGVSGGRGR